jgi:hypothetical protein
MGSKNLQSTSAYNPTKAAAIKGLRKSVLEIIPTMIPEVKKDNSNMIIVIKDCLKKNLGLILCAE